MKAFKVIAYHARRNPLLPIMIHMSSGEPDHSSTVTLGARGDSYYEYLLKLWVQTGKTSMKLKNLYIDTVDRIKKDLLAYSYPNNYAFLGELRNKITFIPKMDHLVCFFPGTLAYGYLHGMPKSHLDLAKDLMRSCYHMYEATKTGLSPEIVIWHRSKEESDKYDGKDFHIKYSDSFNLLRPETVESLFYLYQITKDHIYQKWAWNIFQAFEKHSKVESGGYAPIIDVTSLNSFRRDKMESFWLAETLKYLYLIFDEKSAKLVDLRRWVFNTEAHPFIIPKSQFLTNKFKNFIDPNK